MLYQLQDCPIFVTILNEVKPNESNLRVRSLVIFNEVKKKRMNKIRLVSTPRCFLSLKHDVDIQLYPVVAFGLRMNTTADMLSLTCMTSLPQSPSGARLTSLTFRL